MHVIRVGINMEIGTIGGIIITIVMLGMTFVGLHINKPFPWEKDDE